jgi:hypothetical protein
MWEVQVNHFLVAGHMTEEPKPVMVAEINSIAFKLKVHNIFAYINIYILLLQ